MIRNLTGIVVVLAFSMSLVSMSLIATPSILSKAYAQNYSGSALTKVNKTGGLISSPKEAMTSGLGTAKNASSSPSKFIGGAPLNQSSSNSSSTK